MVCDPAWRPVGFGFDLFKFMIALVCNCMQSHWIVVSDHFLNAILAPQMKIIFAKLIAMNFAMLIFAAFLKS